MRKQKLYKALEAEALAEGGQEIVEALEAEAQAEAFREGLEEALERAKALRDWDLYSDTFKSLYGTRPCRYY